MKLYNNNTTLGVHMAKMQEDIAQYFSAYNSEVTNKLNQIRNLVFEIIPNAEEAIKYGIPTFIYHGNLVHYAGFKNHIGFYPVPS